MKKIMMIGAILAATTSFALADTATPPTGDTAKKQMEDNPGTTGGSTAMPTAKPSTSAPGDKQAKDLPKAGTTADPTAKPETGDTAAKEMKDNAGVE